MPRAKRECDAFLLAVTTLFWGWGDRPIEGSELLAEIGVQLRRLYEAPQDALKAIQADTSSSGSDGARVRELNGIAEEMSARASWVWLEALFIVESAIAGQQFFNHAFNVETIAASG